MKPLYTQEEFDKAKGKDLLPLECKICEKLFYKSKRRIKDCLREHKGSTGQFCSQKCLSIHKTSSVIVECASCKAPIEKTKKIIEKSKTGKFFCSHSCAASYNNRSHSVETKNKISETLLLKDIGHLREMTKQCKKCGIDFIVKWSKRNRAKFCSWKCAQEYLRSTPISDVTRRKLSKSRLEKIKNGIINGSGMKMIFEFNNKKIKCESKIEYACLDRFIKNYSVIEIERCDFYIDYIDEVGKKRKYLPDFKLYTTVGIFIAEAKSIVGKTLNKKWRNYNERSIIKKESLKNFCEISNMSYIWFTKDMHQKFYNSLPKQQSAQGRA